MSDLLSDSFWPLCLLVVVATVGTVLVRVVRRWMKQPDVPAGTGFTLQQLRQLRQEGKMTDEEFARASALVSSLQSAQFLSAAKTKPTSNKAK